MMSQFVLYFSTYVGQLLTLVLAGEVVGAFNAAFPGRLTHTVPVHSTTDVYACKARDAYYVSSLCEVP